MKKRYAVNIGFNDDYTTNWYETDNLRSAKIKASKSEYHAGFDGMQLITPLVVDTLTNTFHYKSVSGRWIHYNVPFN